MVSVKFTKFAKLIFLHCQDWNDIFKWLVPCVSSYIWLHTVCWLLGIMSQFMILLVKNKFYYSFWFNVENILVMIVCSYNEACYILFYSKSFKPLEPSFIVYLYVLTLDDCDIAMS